MDPYESPTIEQAGGPNNHIEPNAIFIVPDIWIAVELMYVWLNYKITGRPPEHHQQDKYILLSRTGLEVGRYPQRYCPTRGILCTNCFRLSDRMQRFLVVA